MDAHACVWMLMRVCACTLVIELLFVLVWLGLYVDAHACVWMFMRECVCTLVIELLFVQAILPEEDAKVKMKFLKNYFSFSIFNNSSCNRMFRFTFY